MTDKIYLVIHGWDYEGSSVKSANSTVELAIEGAKTIMRGDEDYRKVPKRALANGVLHKWQSFGEYVEIRVFPVQA